MAISREEFLGIIMDVSKKCKREIVFIDSLLKHRRIDPALKMRLLETRETLLTQDHLIRRMVETQFNIQDILEEDSDRLKRTTKEKE